MINLCPQGFTLAMIVVSEELICLDLENRVIRSD
jgi:hypothetical protein